MARLADPARSYAVLVGTSAYRSDELGDLPAVRNNLEDLRAVLTDPDLGGLRPDHCVVLHDPADDLTVIDEVWRCAERAEDTLLVYVAGHGLPGPRTGDLFFALSRTDPGQLPFRTLRYDDLRGVVMNRGRFPAANRVVVLDCCYAGRALPMMSGDRIAGMTDIEGVYVLTATAANRRALADPHARHTAFTGELLRVLRDGVADGPELLTLGAVYDQVLRAMTSGGLPLPEQMNKDTVAQLALGRNAAFRAAPPAQSRSPSVGPVVKIVGVGGAGVSAINRMVEAGLAGVEFVAINTDTQSLRMCDADVKVDIGQHLTEGLGAAVNPKLGRAAAEDHVEQIEAALAGADMVFLTCGEGGGTGTGGAPVVAAVARALGALTIGVVTRPFSFEGRRRQVHADAGIAELRGRCDTLIVVPNDRLLAMGDRGASMMDAFRLADDVVLTSVRGITDLIATPGVIDIGYGAVRATLRNAGNALIGLGSARGQGRVLAAVRGAVSNPLVEQGLAGARSVVLSVAGDSRIAYGEVSDAAQVVVDAVHPDANIIFGTVLDDALGDEVRVTVIAAGFAPGV